MATTQVTRIRPPQAAALRAASEELRDRFGLGVQVSATTAIFSSTPSFALQALGSIIDKDPKSPLRFIAAKLSAQVEASQQEVAVS